MKKGKIAILTGGGDTCALNNSIETVRNMAFSAGYEVYGILSGWKGLLGDGDLVDITRAPINTNQGGSLLGSSRTNPFKKDAAGKDNVEAVLNNIKRYKLNVIIAIGGDDTVGAAKKFYDLHQIPVIGFPKTIDNDLRTQTMHHHDGVQTEAVLCPGFPTAAEKISNLARQLRTTAQTHHRIFVMEVMGRNAGWLPAAAIHGDADFVLVPEIEMTAERVEAFFDKVDQRYREKGNLIIAVSEGVGWHNPKTGQNETIKTSLDLDEYGHPRLGGIAGHIASEITARKINKDARSQATGYIPRAGFINQYDRQLTTALGYKALKMLTDEEYGRLPVMDKITDLDDLRVFHTKSIDISEIENKPLPLDVYYDSQNFRPTKTYEAFLFSILGEKLKPVERGKFTPIKPE